MRAREIIGRIEKAKCDSDKACLELRVRGSHHFFECSCKKQVCRTTVPNHGAKDLGTGLLHKIERNLEPCLGEGWLLR